MNSTSRTIALTLAATSAFVIPSAAEADTYCVGSCAGQGTVLPTLPAALAEAAKTPAKDRIVIKAGVAEVNAEALSGNPVQIVGAGSEKTRLVGKKDKTTPVLRLEDPASTVSGLTIQLGPGAVGSGLQLDGGAASSIDVVDSPAAMASIQGTGVTLAAQTSLSDSRVLIADPKGTGVNGVTATPSGGGLTTIDRVEITGDNALSKLGGEGTVTGRNLNIHDTRLGVSAIGGSGTLRVSSTLVRVDPAASDAVALAAIAGSAGAKPTLVARGVTAVGGETGRAGAYAIGTSNGDNVHVRLMDTVIAGFEYSLGSVGGPGAAAEVRSSSSSYETARITTLDGGSVLTSLDDFPGPLAFVDPVAGDFRLKVPSGGIEKGSTEALDPLDATTDLAGNPRLLDSNGDGLARIDMGAYEAPAKPFTGGQGGQGGPQVGGGGSSIKPPAKDSTKPRVTRIGRSGSSVRFQLSEPAAVRVVLSRRAKPKRGKTVFRTVKRLSRKGTVGTNRISLGAKLPAGRYRVTITATDSAGNRSAVTGPVFGIKRARPAGSGKDRG